MLWFKNRKPAVIQTAEEKAREEKTAIANASLITAQAFREAIAARVELNWNVEYLSKAVYQFACKAGDGYGSEVTYAWLKEQFEESMELVLQHRYEDESGQDYLEAAILQNLRGLLWTTHGDRGTRYTEISTSLNRIAAIAFVFSINHHLIDFCVEFAIENLSLYQKPMLDFAFQMARRRNPSGLSHDELQRLSRKCITSTHMLLEAYSLHCLRLIDKDKE